MSYTDTVMEMSFLIEDFLKETTMAKFIEPLPEEILKYKSHL